MWFAELFAELLLIFEDYKFWKKKKARRKYEKENNLPKKTMVYPSTKIYVIALVVLSISGGLFFYLFTRDTDENKTVKRLTTIQTLLEAEKKTFQKYPSDLSKIIRNNPLHKNLLTDSWNNHFHYELSNDDLNYILISKGKDGKLHTDDDIKL
ncbi:type II secretion system protein GspG [Winogradskyella schleiferi]|uniref:type II secretion system protein GspG n=1 Tax=Winogradskyella schleiferi TaxID=2686078 RepID=UPI0015BB1635|nr:type II secretion system protein GspG [Winogradskyella schleiferi]